MEIIHMNKIRGRVTTNLVTDGVWSPITTVNNLVLYDSGPVFMANLLNRPDGKDYYINAMYIEFANTGATVSTPTFNRGGASTYYDNLNISDATRDYLRIPIIATSSSNSNESNFSANNVGTFYAQTQSTTGVHGLTFSSAAGSYVYGGGLVVARVWGDSSQDLVFSRVYFTAGNQIAKPSSSQVGLTWEITCD